MHILHHHPFAVDAHFRTSLVLGFAAPIDAVRVLLPPQLEPDTFDNRYGFLAVAIVDAQNLRPAGFPSIFGRTFLLVGYRVFARFRTASGKRLRGLYILRSETDRRSMVVLGNLFTRYGYVHSQIRLERSDRSIQVRSGDSGLSIHATTSRNAALPAGSVFGSQEQARRFAGPLPFTFSTTRDPGEMLIVEGSRERWTPRPVNVSTVRVPYLEELVPSGLILSNAFIVEDISYYWRKGRTERWAGAAAGFMD